VPSTCVEERRSHGIATLSPCRGIISGLPKPQGTKPQGTDPEKPPHSTSSP
jgi:hypothetical protein